MKVNPNSVKFIGQETKEEAPSPSAPISIDFSEYMWMENEEEFDQEVMKQLEEEALMEECIEAMLEDEIDKRNSPKGQEKLPDMASSFDKLSLGKSSDEVAKFSTLNPNAAEFVPRAKRTSALANPSS